MSKNMKNEHNPFLMVLYIAAVVAAVVGLFFVYKESVKRQEEYQAQVEEIKKTEDPDLERNSWVTADDAIGEEDSKEIDDIEENSDKNQAESDQAADQTEPNAEEAGNDEEPAVSATPEPSATPAVSADTSLSVVVLNGTGREGVASQWAETLKNGGYANTIPATYTGTAEERTVIYAASEEQGAPFLEIFPNGEVRVGAVDVRQILTGTGVNLPAQVDVYIIVGKSEIAAQ